MLDAQSTPSGVESRRSPRTTCGSIAPSRERRSGVVVDRAIEDLVGTAGWGPADRAALEAADAPAGHVLLVARRVAQARALEAELSPALADRAVDLMGTGRR